jgi:hypothetical protein
LRGYLTHPNQHGKPKPGTTQELAWSKGWVRADYQSRLANQSQLALEMENDENFGRDTYASRIILDEPEF